MEALTERQQRVLDLILDFFDREDRPPTTRELAQQLGLHVKTVYQYLLVLERKGCIERDRRHIRVVPELRASRGIPVVGHVAAGTPVLAVENREGVLSLEDTFGRDGVFAVRVEGDSMRDAGILDGDLAVVQVDAAVPPGGVAVCYMDDEVTVKRLHERKGGFDLIPENDAYETIHIAKGTRDFRVGGRVIGIVRRMG
jgi:repressor LexA